MLTAIINSYINIMLTTRIVLTVRIMLAESDFFSILIM